MKRNSHLSSKNEASGMYDIPLDEYENDRVDIPAWADTFFGTSYRKFARTWNEVKSRWIEKHEHILNPNRPLRPLDKEQSSQMQLCMTEELQRKSDSSSYDGTTEAEKKFKRRRKLATGVVTLAVVIVLITCIVSAVLVHVNFVPSRNNFIEARMYGRITNRNFTEELANKSSEEFLRFQKELCIAVQIKVNEETDCLLDTVKEGSIIVEFIIYAGFSGDSKEFSSKILIAIKGGKPEGSGYILGLFEFNNVKTLETRMIVKEKIPPKAIHYDGDQDTEVSSALSSAATIPIKITGSTSVIWQLKSSEILKESLSVLISTPIKIDSSEVDMKVSDMLETSSPMLSDLIAGSFETTRRTLELSSAKTPSSSLELSSSVYSKPGTDARSSSMSYKLSPVSLVHPPTSWKSNSPGNAYSELEQGSSEIKIILLKQSSSVMDYKTAETKSSKLDETLISAALISTFISGSLIPTPTSSFDSTTNLKSTTTTFLSYSLRPSPTQDTVQLSSSAYSTITRPDVYVRDVVMYQDEGNLTLGCNISYVDDFTRIIFNVNGVEAGKITGDIIDLQPPWTFRNESNSDKQIYLMTLEEPNCTHSGNYTCSIGGDWGVVQQTATIQVRAAPGVPVVTIPDEVVEDRLLKQSITCSLDIGIPASMVTWSVEFQDGRKFENFNFNPTEETNSSESCTNNLVSAFISTFNISWHNSSLCCNVDQGNRKTSSCKHLFVVPGDYCSNKTDGLYNHPYDDCYQYIQCFNGILYINNCNKAGDFCFNKASQSCTQPKATTTMDPSQASDPYSCDGKINFSYIPVRGSCKDYMRCVHGAQVADACAGSSYFVDTVPGQICTNDINQAYCTLHNNK